MTEQVTRGNLPHWYCPGHAHFVTYRLAGSLPATFLKELKRERARRLAQQFASPLQALEHRQRVHKLLFAKYDAALDASSGPMWLGKPEVAKIVRENLYHHHGSKYELIAYTVMSNHVHVLFQPFESALRACGGGDEGGANHAGSVLNAGGETDDQVSVLSGIMHSLKSFTANRANRLLGLTGRFWQRESYDHWVRDIDELERIVAYIAHNPVRAGLCRRPEEWRFSSAFDRYQSDQSTCALVGWLRNDWQR
jgi:putative DNA methylase